MTDLRVALEVDLAVAPGQTQNAAAVWASAQAALPAATLSAKAPTADGRCASKLLTPQHLPNK